MKPNVGNNQGAGADQHDSSNQEGPQGTMFFRAGQVADEPGDEGKASEGQPALIGLSAPFAQKQFGLTPGRTTIGRKQDNDISLNESSISSTHARIIHEKGQWRILNLLSTNGTFVNGRKVTEAVLQHGDRVRLGRAEFLFRSSDRPLPEHGNIASSGGRSPLVLLMIAAVAVVAGVATWLLW